jgi:group I intron endonuclease
MGFIYKIKNTINEKIYVGQTTLTLTKRWNKHLSDTKNGRRCAIHNAIRHHGEHNFTCEIIEECSNEHLNDREIHWISNLKSYQRSTGYNRTLGGQRGTITEDVKHLLSILHTGEGNPMFGKHHSLETREKMSKTRKGRQAPNKGVPHSGLHKKNMSIGIKRAWAKKRLMKNEISSMTAITEQLAHDRCQQEGDTLILQS